MWYEARGAGLGLELVGEIGTAVRRAVGKEGIHSLALAATGIASGVGGGAWALTSLVAASASESKLRR